MLTVFVTTCSIPDYTDANEVSSGMYSITQSWSQEENFRRPYFLHVPSKSQSGRFPVLFFLHGNGGNGMQAMNAFRRTHPIIASKYILVFPEGYQRSWNIVSERSRADDRGFIEAIITKLVTYDNVQGENVSMMGVSNGAAMVNQLAIECTLPNLRNFVTSVSPLNELQHDGNDFKYKGDQNNYRTVATPLAGRRLMNISGTNDRLIPYLGGRSRVIPGRNGKLGFVDAEQSIYLWAKAMGYDGRKTA